MSAGMLKLTGPGRCQTSIGFGALYATPEACAGLRCCWCAAVWDGCWKPDPYCRLCDCALKFWVPIPPNVAPLLSPGWLAVGVAAV